MKCKNKSKYRDTKKLEDFLSVQQQTYSLAQNYFSVEIQVPGCIKKIAIGYNNPYWCYFWELHTVIIPGGADNHFVEIS